MLDGISVVEPEAYPGIWSDFEGSFKKLRSLRADIWLTSHAREFGRYRKFQQRANAKNPADPFIDRAGYLAHIDWAETKFRKLAIQQVKGPPGFMRMVNDWR